MITALCLVELIISDANSLKAKRSVVKSVIEKTRNKFNVSISEVGLNDLWQRAEIGFSVTSNDKKILNKTVDNIIDFISTQNDSDVIVKDTEYINF